MVESSQLGGRKFQGGLPMKRVGAGALVFDRVGKLLIVKPSYKPKWEIPGGIVEADESPAQACRREISEELGITVDPTRLLCVDYNSSTTDYLESLMFIFATEPLTEELVASIAIPPEELVEARFCEPDEAVALLGGRLGQRVEAAMKQPQHACYLEDQDYLPADPDRLR